MSAPFIGSRLANLRQKRTSQIQKLSPSKQIQQPLTLPDQQNNLYQPSMAVTGGRTVTRFLKGRIQKTNNDQKRSSSNLGTQFNIPNKQNNVQGKMSLNLYQVQDKQLKLFLNDSPLMDRRKSEIKNQPQQPQQKRILIQKRQSVEQSKQIQKPAEIKQQQIKRPVNPIQEQVIQPKKQNIGQGTIKQEDVQQSNALQNQNELTECPQGCGRKFNKKALQKHAKACKLVFMSKRKQFNSQAKRVTSQEQASLVKQNKLQQKKAQLGKTKGKGFDKTSDNWKNASQDFRSAVKALKKQGNAQQQGKQQMVMASCQYCQKPFAQVLLTKHLQNCLKRKQKEQKDKKKATKKK